MAESLDNILSGSTPAQETPTVEKEVTQETAAPETTEKPEAGQQAEQPAGQKMVPHEALHAEKQKVKRYTEEVADFRKSNETLQRQVTELLQRVPVPQTQPQQQIDWFQDPDAALKQNLDRFVNPLSQQVSSLQTQLMRLTAVQQHGADKVSAFETYAQEAMSRGDPEMAALSAQMRASPDPIGVGLKWFEKRTFDPAAERERIKAELMQELQPQQGNPAPSVMPSNLAGARNVGNRSGPQWAGPPALADIFKR